MRLRRMNSAASSALCFGVMPGSPIASIVTVRAGADIRP
jgi:hypothetical protein